MEPTRNAWVPLTAWFRRQGAVVILVPPEQSADLRDYYAKHTKSDRLDSRILARLPLLHPEGLRPAEDLGPAEPMRRATRLRASLVKRRTMVVARLDAYLELMGPAWHGVVWGSHLVERPSAIPGRRLRRSPYAAAIGPGPSGQVPMAPFTRRLGELEAARLLDAAAQTLGLWDDELDYAELADDIAAEARLALQLTVEIHELDQRIAVFLHTLDPAGIMTSVPGVGAVNAAQILARLGDPNRFHSLAGVRSFSGFVPSLNSSGVNGRHGGPTKSGDAPLREALFSSADAARRIDPTLAARYHRLMTRRGQAPQLSAMQVSTVLLTRIVAVLAPRDALCHPRCRRHSADSPRKARRIVSSATSSRQTSEPARRTSGKWTGRRSKESLSAPSTDPSEIEVRAGAA